MEKGKEKAKTDNASKVTYVSKTTAGDATTPEIPVPIPAPNTGTVDVQVNVTEPETPTPQEIVVEHYDLSAAYITVTLNAKISPKQYETREAGIVMKMPLDPEASAGARAGMARAMFAECRKLLSEQLDKIVDI